jgi:phosphatidylglycerophosphate synthase
VAIVLTVAVVNLAVARRTFRPSGLGKAATVIYVATGVVTLYENYLGEVSELVTLCVYVSLSVTILSAADYAVRMTRTAPADDRRA